MKLETQRLILRPFTEADAADLFEYLHEPMVNCFADMKSKPWLKQRRKPASE